MKAMILAAGRGERMRPLTDTLPKPLLCVAEKPLIVYHLEKLAELGVQDVIINIAYLGDKIRQALGDGSKWGLSIVYSQEPEPLETGGALLQALPLLGDDPFLLINGDVWTDFDFSLLAEQCLQDSMACLVFVNNPSHNPGGDFALDQDGCVRCDKSQANFTFSGMALVNPNMIKQYSKRRPIFPLREVFNECIERQALSGIHYGGHWCDVGTPVRLSQLEEELVD